MPNHDNGINAILISMGIIDNSPGYSDKQSEADNKLNSNRPRYGSK